jgi:lipopolysaccharide transport system ATP-binding protein
MSSKLAIKVENLSKCYQIYDQPQDRLKQSIYPRLKRFVGLPAHNYYREFWALKDISFAVSKGETVGIVGRNGSGKSTLLQLICGTLSPTGGRILASGRIAALLELGSGFHKEFTGQENIYMNASVLGLSTDEINDRLPDILDFADIGEFIHQPIKTYSSGMSMRLAFAVAVHVDPQILVIDEALAVGDEVFQRKCFSRIESIKASGTTVLFVSHAGSAIIALCDRALLLDQGKLLATGRPKTIVGEYQKLLYAPREKQAAIRAEIQATQAYSLPGKVSQSDSRGTSQSNSSISPEIAANGGNPPAEAKATVEYLDPNLRPKSTISYESNGALIHKPQILTLSGKSVNCLQRGQSYRYTYTVAFHDGATQVRFGMLIKTLSGIDLGGAVSASSFINGIPYVEPESQIQVEFRFHCLLNPGVYFLNAGVLGARHTEEIYLHRLLDAFMFRVLPCEASLTTGIVHFKCDPEVTVLSGNDLAPVV